MISLFHSFVAGLYCIASCFGPSYEYHRHNQVLRVTAHNHQIEELERIVELHKYDLWHRKNNIFHIHVPASNLEKLPIILNGFKVSVMVKDVQKLIDLENESPRSFIENNDERFFSSYHSSEEYVEYISDLPDVKMKVLNQTYNKNDIVAFQFGSGNLSAGI
jgi:hypothetical protein